MVVTETFVFGREFEKRERDARADENTALINVFITQTDGLQATVGINARRHVPHADVRRQERKTLRQHDVRAPCAVIEIIDAGAARVVDRTSTRQNSSHKCENSKTSSEG